MLLVIVAVVLIFDFIFGRRKL